MTHGSTDPVANLFQSLLSASAATPGLAMTPPAGGQGPARMSDGEAAMLRADIERLLMITEALWSMMKDQFEYTDQHLVARITEIDAKDGKVDGRVASLPPQACPKCGRPSSRKRAICMYCGQAIPSEPFAR
ncbi:MAG: zinc ribbon domain-containing protein [bacterium]